MFFGPRSKKLDVVMAHYDPARTAATLYFWLGFLKSEKVSALEGQRPFLPYGLGGLACFTLLPTDTARPGLGMLVGT